MLLSFSKDSVRWTARPARTFPLTARRLHPLPLRIMHWINAAAMLVMVTSGWGIYDDDVIIRGFHFSHFWCVLQSPF
jgi:thiosulfate reductase cytochrome b subunit